MASPLSGLCHMGPGPFSQHWLCLSSCAGLAEPPSGSPANAGQEEGPGTHGGQAGGQPDGFLVTQPPLQASGFLLTQR